MTAVLLGTFEPGSDSWHALRAKGIGGSEVAPILGISPYESRFSLFHRKASNIGPVEENEAMEWGKRLEPAVAKKFLELHPTWDALPGSTWVHADRPYQIANPDLLPDGLDELCEIKTARTADGWGEPGTDDIPVHYRAQAQWYLDTFERSRCHVAVLIGGSDYREYLVDYDPTEAAELRTAAEAFLDDVAARRYPPIDAHEATYVALQELHPEIDGSSIELDEDIATLAVQTNLALAEAKTNAQLAKNLIADAMGNAQKATWCEFKIADRRVKKTDGARPYVQLASHLDKTGLADAA